MKIPDILHPEESLTTRGGEEIDNLLTDMAELKETPFADWEVEIRLNWILDACYE